MEDKVKTVAVVADTHVPDRVGALHPGLLSSLRMIRPDLILHCGDICTPGVLEDLRQVAPVEAVRGNRDWLFVGILPNVRHLEFNGINVTLLHGHGTFLEYWIDKWRYMRHGYSFARYTRMARRVSRNTKVFVFGHTHHPECKWEGDVLMFNPGSASVGPNRNGFPSFGILKFFENGIVEGKIQSLGNLKWDGKHWANFG